jgi:hypothetical protein
VAAAATYAGLAVRGNRKDLGGALDPIAPLAAEPQRLAFERVMSDLVRDLGLPGGADEVRERTGDLLDEAMEKFRGGADRLEDEQTARLVLGLQDKLARDRAAEFAEPADLVPAQRLWRFLARHCVPPYRDHAAAPLTLLAWTSWLADDTPTTRVALSRALEADPGYTLAQLLYDSLNGGLKPDRLRRTVREERAKRLAKDAQRSSSRRTARRTSRGERETGPEEAPDARADG